MMEKRYDSTLPSFFLKNRIMRSSKAALPDTDLASPFFVTGFFPLTHSSVATDWVPLIYPRYRKLRLSGLP
jgi:hypothetical protein